MSTIKLELTGGLGNQLFGYAYAKHVAPLFNLKLVLDGAVTERILKRPADLFEFTLDGEKRLSLSDYSHLSTSLNRLLWRFERVRQITNRHQSPILSWDLDYKKLANGCTLRGFFQGEEALSVVENNKRSLFELRNPSENFITMSQEFKKRPVTSIHVRRGDYRNYVDNFGLLSPKYYANVLQENEVETEGGEIWLFSDEPNQSLAELRKVGVSASNVVSPSDMSPSETLKLMSLSRRLITANSSFSWWAGALGEDIEVITPQPWFRKEDDWLKESSLIPTKWKRYPADWLDNG